MRLAVGEQVSARVAGADWCAEIVARARRGAGRRGLALLLVAGIHVCGALALASGLMEKSTIPPRQLAEVTIVDVPSAPKLPPPPETVVPLPAFVPPPFVPLPEINVRQPPTERSITAVSAEKPSEVVAVQRAPVSAAAKPVSARINASRSCRLPEYPASARRNELTGVVLLRFLIDEAGRVVESEVKSSSGHRILDEAARRALAQCEFIPGTLDGKPQKAWAEIRYVWDIK